MSLFCDLGEGAEIGASLSSPACMLHRFPSEIMPALMPNLWDSLVPGLSVQHTGDCPGRVQCRSV